MTKKMIVVNQRPTTSIDIPIGYTGRPHSCIELTEWSNGEGYDITMWDVPKDITHSIIMPRYVFDRIKECIEAIDKYYDDLDEEKENAEILTEVKKEMEVE